MRPDQLGDFRVPSDAFLHPDGERAVFVVAQMDLDEDEYVRQIWIWDGELSRSGTPKHRVERFDAILAWHDKYLEK